MKKILSIISIFAVILASSSVFAGGPCPRSALSLEAYAGCTVPVIGTKGRVIGRAATARQMDPHTASVMNVMNRTAVVPPHSNPIVPAAASVASNMAVAYSIYHHGKYAPNFYYNPYYPTSFWMSVPLAR